MKNLIRRNSLNTFFFINDIPLSQSPRDSYKHNKLNQWNVGIKDM